jgi:hypothetical protein
MILGGAQENTLLTCEGLAGRGHDVTLITGPALGPEGELMTRARRGGYRVEVIDELRREVNPLLDWRAYRRLGFQRFLSAAQDVQPSGRRRAGHGRGSWRFRSDAKYRVSNGAARP